jgi:hypothetical protein
MPTPSINAVEALDAATAATIQCRREKLWRIAEGRGIRVGVAYACAAIVAICATVAYFAGDRRAALILGTEFCALISFIFIGISAARRKALRELRDMNRSS